MNFKKISILDTSIVTENMGDKIIVDYSGKIIKEIFGDSFYVNIPTHEYINRPSYKHINSSHYRIILGTNLLSSNMLRRNQWKINFFDTFFLKDIILLGVGWWQYQNNPDIYTKYLYKKVLSKDKLHSVRDSYTESKLKSIGIKNVINTGCPTMWNLTPTHCKEIPHHKARDVIFTLTDYNKNPELDKFLVDTLLNNYENVYFWIQAYDDYDYLKTLVDIERIKIILPTLEALDNVLQKESIDFVGTRLHAGIRSLNFKNRTIIIGVDNRAQEISNDTNIVVISRKNLKKDLENKINSTFETKINLPLENIKLWKSQFK